MAGYATPAWTNDAAPAIDADALNAMGEGIELAEHPYGVCATASATAAKVVTIDFSGTLTLFTGMTIHVKFTNGNTAGNPTLNVNGTGAISIMEYGSVAAGNGAWSSGQIVDLTYDGTNWVIRDSNGVLTLSTGSFTILPKTIVNPAIRSDHIVTKMVLTNIHAQSDEWTFNTETPGQITISGKIFGSTAISELRLEPEGTVISSS